MEEVNKAVDYIKEQIEKEADHLGRVSFVIDSGFWATVLKEAKEQK